MSKSDLIPLACAAALLSACAQPQPSYPVAQYSAQQCPEAGPDP